MNLPFEKDCENIIETEKIANELSFLLNPGDVIVLNGNLGSGKTTLIKAICKNYGIKNVSSPSFSIVNEYFGRINVFHFDFYRIKKLVELYDIGFEEYLSENDAIVFIEWGELMKDILPKNYYEIQLEFVTPDKRKIKIKKNNN